MTKPPAGSSLLFGSIADSGRIKQRKNGSYRMVLDGVDEIDWFTDRPDRYEGLWKPQKLIRRWDKYFATSEPNAQAAVEIGEDRHLMTFEMFKPRYNPGSRRMAFKINASIINKRERQLADELTGMNLTDISLFIDDATTDDDECTISMYFADLDGVSLTKMKLISEASDLGSMYHNSFSGADLSNAEISNMTIAYSDMIGATLTDAVFNGNSMLVTDFTGADADGADFSDSDLTGSYFNGATFTDVNFSNATIADCDFSDADLTGADFTNADISDDSWANIWDNTTCPDGTNSDNNSKCGLY